MKKPKTVVRLSDGTELTLSRAETNKLLEAISNEKNILDLREVTIFMNHITVIKRPR